MVYCSLVSCLLPVVKLLYLAGLLLCVSQDSNLGALTPSSSETLSISPFAVWRRLAMAPSQLDLAGEFEPVTDFLFRIADKVKHNLQRNPFISSHVFLCSLLKKNLQLKKSAGVAFSTCLALTFRAIRQGRFTLQMRFLVDFLPQVQCCGASFIRRLRFLQPIVTDMFPGGTFGPCGRSSTSIITGHSSYRPLVSQ